MIDIKLDAAGDMEVSDLGDISLTNSPVQAAKIRLRWIYNEWRLGPQYGFRWFEEVFVKNPNIEKIKSLVRSEIMQVYRVTDARVDEVVYDAAKRSARFRFTMFVGEETYMEEVTLYG